MAISSVAARKAYGIGISPTPVKSEESQAIVPPENFSSPNLAKGVRPEASETARVSEAAATLSFVSSKAKEATKLEPARIRSLLGNGDDEETLLPARAEVEGLARRYIKIMGSGSAKDSTDEQVKKLSDFYGASPDRTTRLGQMVIELERGQESSSDNGSVAVA